MSFLFSSPEEPPLSVDLSRSPVVDRDEPVERETDSTITKVTVEDGAIVATLVPNDCVCGGCSTIVLIDTLRLSADDQADLAGAFSVIEDVVRQQDADVQANGETVYLKVIG